MMLENSIDIYTESQKVLSICLETQRKLRQALIENFREKEPDIYRPCFEFEKHDLLLQLSLEKFFLIWVDKYWVVVNDVLNKEKLSSNLTEQVKTDCAALFLKLLQSINDDQQHSQSFVAIELFKSHIIFLENLINTAEAANKNYNELLYLHTKDQVLFDREFEKIKQQQE